MGMHSRILAWIISWTEEPGRLHGLHGLAKGQTQLRGLHLLFFCVIYLRLYVFNTTLTPDLNPEVLLLQNKNANSFACHVMFSTICPQLTLLS